MTPGTRIALAVGIAAVLDAGFVSAHHSFSGEFDAAKLTTVRGVVTRFDWINPHSFIYVDAKLENGQVEHWALEGPGVLQLSRRGLNKDTFKAGDTLEACGYGARDDLDLRNRPAASGRRLLSAERLTLADGQKLVWSQYGKGKCLVD